MGVRRALYTGMGYLLMILLLVICVGPFLWMLTSSIKPSRDLFATPPKFVDFSPTLDHYRAVLFKSDFSTWFSNSLIVALATSVVCNLVAIPGAFSLARYRYPGRKLIGRFVLLAYMFPAIVMLVPLFQILKGLHLNNTLAGLVVADTTFALPFSLWTLRSFFVSIPVDMEEAAMLDGCTRLGAFWRVVLPTVLPGIATTVLFSFILAWNEFILALTLVQNESVKTVSLGLYSFIGLWSVDWGQVMATGVLACVPVVLLFTALQKYFVQGLTAGSVKG